MLNAGCSFPVQKKQRIEGNIGRLVFYHCYYGTGKNPEHQISSVLGTCNCKRRKVLSCFVKLQATQSVLGTTHVPIIHRCIVHWLTLMLLKAAIGESYVYWTVHHLDSWIKIDQLMSFALFFAAQHVSNASTFIFRSLRLCVGILLWFDAGWSTASACIRIPHHPIRTTP